MADKKLYHILLVNPNDMGCFFVKIYLKLAHIGVYKMSEMQKVSEVFKSYLNYYQRVAHKKLF